MSDDELVLVTGASGFIANHVVQQLQQKGYRVRGTIRDLKNEKRVNELKQLCPDAKHPLELIEADLLQPEGWIEAVKECTYVMHTASPVPAEQPKNENEVIEPAVQGTLNVLKACKEAACVKRVVITSSAAAVGEIEKEQYDESDWADDKGPYMNAYRKSKVLAEKAAWDFIKDEGSDIELVTLQPVLVLGPVLTGSVRSSVKVGEVFLENKYPFLPNISMPICDVRDVAAAHIAGITCQEAANNRHIIYTGNMWMSEVAQVIQDEFKPQGYKIPTKNAPYFLLWIFSKFETGLKYILPYIGNYFGYSNKRMTSVLGITPHPMKDSILDMCYSMVETGIVKKTQGYTGPKYSTDK